MRDYVPVSPRLIHGRRLRERSQDGEIFRNTDDAVRVPVKRVAVMNSFSECDVLVIVGGPAGFHHRVSFFRASAETALFLTLFL